MGHKTESANMVSRERRKVTDDTSNKIFDETTFSGSEDGQLQSLVFRKKALEIDLSNVNLSLTRAKTQAFHSGKYLDPRNWKKLNDRTVALRQKILDIEKEIAPLKAAIKARNIAANPQRLTVQYDTFFSEYFHAAAKEMLAGPVYDRVATAAIHRMRLAKEDASEK